MDYMAQSFQDDFYKGKLNFSIKLGVSRRGKH